MKKTIQQALADNKLVYVVFTSGIYQGQIVGIKNIYQFDSYKKNGDFKLHNITTPEETVSRMIRRA